MPQAVGYHAGVIARVRLLHLGQLQNPVRSPPGILLRVHRHVVLEPRHVRLGVALGPALQAHRAAHGPHERLISLHLLQVLEHWRHCAADTRHFQNWGLVGGGGESAGDSTTPHSTLFLLVAFLASPPPLPTHTLLVSPCLASPQLNPPPSNPPSTSTSATMM